MIISASGVVIRTDMSTVRIAGRITQGVTLMGLNDGDTVVAIATTNGKKPDAGDEADDTDDSSEKITDTASEEETVDDEIVDDNTVAEES
jgi:DNA gyrase subunit A